MDKAKAMADIDAVLATPVGDPKRMVERITLYHQCVLRWAPLNSAYREQAARFAATPLGYSHDHMLRGALVALRRDVEADCLSSFEEEIHGELFSDFLVQAEHLNGEGFRRAAAVLAGGVLEEHLRPLCKRNGIATGAHVKASSMNNELKKAGVYGEAVRTELESWLKRRNDAAHGDPDFEAKHDEVDVGRMAEGIRSFTLKCPA
jgi:hypothetical protein